MASSARAFASLAGRSVARINMAQKRLKELLGIEIPIIQAPMAGVCDSKLAIAVSEAGGLGSLPCAILGPDAIRKEVHAIRSATNKPFNINFFCHKHSEPQKDAIENWLALFSGYYKEFGIDPADICRDGPVRLPFNEEMANVVLELKPPVVSFHFGLPSPELLATVRASGAKILSSATTVEEAIWLESHGVDAVIAQGYEAGGHRGMFLSTDVSKQIGTFALVPQVVDALSIPVIAAGGISSPQSVRAAMSLGASGVQVGTTYLLCPEATTSASHRQALKSDSSRTTAVTNVFTGRPARAIVNRLVRELGPINSAAPSFPFATVATAPIRTKIEKDGNADFSALWAGQNVAGCREIPAGEMTRFLAGGVEEPTGKE
jgi:nitronate monooxygenase